MLKTYCDIFRKGSGIRDQESNEVYDRFTINAYTITPQNNIESELMPESVLFRIPDIHVVIESDNTLRISSDHHTIHCGSHGLAVLDAFTSPKTFAEALASLTRSATGTQDWMDMSSTVYSLFNAGILRTKESTHPFVSSQTGFGSMPIHVAMLNDRLRTRMYLDAIAQTVKPGDVVLDIGTGTGVLSVAAARAGAHRVYAIEAGAMADVAEAVFELNGVSDRITLIRSWSTKVELPERADVLISEIIGSDPLSERIIEATRDATTRLLKPDARLLPSALRVYGLAVTIPRSDVRERYPTEENVAEWFDRYDLRFDPMQRAIRNAPQKFYVKPHGIRDWHRLAEPVLLSSIDLRDIQSNAIENVGHGTITDEGTMDGVAVYFETDLSNGITLSTHPDKTDTHCSWAMPVWSVPEAKHVKVGDQFSMSYSYNIRGVDDGLVTVKSAERRA